MEWHEVNPLPSACARCKEQDCYNCEYAALRWKLSREDELRTRRKMLVKAIERLQKQMKAVDEEIKRIQRK